MGRRAKRAKVKAKAKRPLARKSRGKDGSSRRELEKRLAEALEQQAATSEILRIIGTSPTDAQPIFDGIARSGVRLCGALGCAVFVVHGDMLHVAATHGIPPDRVARFRSQFPAPLVAGPGSDGRSEVDAPRAVLERRIFHLADIENNPEASPEQVEMAQLGGYRTRLMVPMMRGDKALGLIAITSRAATPFTDQQIELLQTFADQAVIAIENVRLFKELEARNRQLTEALDQQTATADILRVISSSPTDLVPVMKTLVESAARLCEAQNAQIFRLEDDQMRLVARHGPVRSSLDVGQARPITRGSVSGRAILDRTTIHLPDLLAEVESEYPDIAPAIQREGIRATIGAPLLREGSPIGSITAFRTEARPFSDKQIGLLKTFADQAVIAIENVRLFTELQDKNRALTEAHAQVTEALEQQTATSEILRVISSSPTDVQPVFGAIVESAVRLCDGARGNVYTFDGELLHHAAEYNETPESAEFTRATFPRRPGRDLAVGRAILDRDVVHIPDVERDPEFPQALARARGVRSVVVVPLLRGGSPIGAIAVGRHEPAPFSRTQIELLKTFADQAVIAIENVRLFQELQAKTRELARSVEELQALGEVGQAVSSTLDLETVLTTIVSRANQLSGTDAGAIFEYDEETEEFYLRATQNLDEKIVELARAMPLRRGEGAVGRLAETREPVQVSDILDESAYRSRLRDLLTGSGYRALLAVPLLREQHIIGGLVVNRKEPGEFSPDVIELLRTFATQSALAIQNARLFREIEEKSRQLEAASRHKSEFLANMSHELRTPLNAIIGFSEVLAERMFGEVNDKQAEYLQDILASGRHLLSLINDILDLSKVEAGRLALELGSFNLPVAVENALTLVRERATRHGISLAQAIDGRVGDIVADERKVKQILLNLLSNAVKFTPAGGRVAVTATPSDGVIEISVSDTGIGIAPEDQTAIFEEFRQVGKSDAQRPEGTGLGLTLAKKFVELHGGQIWVRSQVGQGSTFTFSLPVRPWPTS